MSQQARNARSDRARRYTPLSGALVAVLLAAFVLPSALNVPQSNPQQTLEFAPIPPDDQDQPPPDSSNLESLGLGSSSSFTGDALGGDGAGQPGLPPLPEVPDGVGDRPVTKRCVGSPPRQTEDPIAPPCVAHFEGDNGGATYQGVTAEDIRVVFYFDGSNGFNQDAVTSRGREERPVDECIDLLAQAPDDEDHVFVRELHNFQTYFNARYQTYQRSVRFVVCFDGSSAATPESRRADAATHLGDWAPFAILSYGSGYNEDYVEAMVEGGALAFGARGGQAEEYFQRWPGRVWGYLPTIEQQGRSFADAVCTQVVPYPVSSAGEGFTAGQERELGLLRSGDETLPQYQRFATATRESIEACGGKFALERSFPIAESTSGTDPANRPGESNDTAAVANMSAFQREGVTTIVWPQGMEAQHSQAAGRLRYFPEWIVAGDRFHDSYWNAQDQDQDVWHEHAWVVSTATLKGDAQDTYCYQALKEANPESQDAGWVCAFKPWYEDLRQLFTGIQVAGPRLTPETIDRGMHAIPAIPSADPRVPACFYLVGDYTCVKDAIAMWWDRAGQAPGGTRVGCWRAVDGARRYLVGDWPERDVAASRTPSDPCNGYSGAGWFP